MITFSVRTFQRCVVVGGARQDVAGPGPAETQAEPTTPHHERSNMHRGSSLSENADSIEATGSVYCIYYSTEDLENILILRTWWRRSSLLLVGQGVMALAPFPLALPRTLVVASLQPFPLPTLSLLSSPSACSIATAKRRCSAPMGSSSSVIARASSINPSTNGFDESSVDTLGNVQILATSTGKPVLLKGLWDQNEGIAVVALLRHFGCICCWELASELKELIPRFESAGVKLIAIGIGTPDNARILAEGLPFPLDYLYADPDRKAYNVLGLYYGFGRTFLNPASAKVFSRLSSIRKAGKNYTLSATPKDRSSVLQQGGMLVFKGKELLYARKDEGTGDHAPLEEVLNICCKVPAA